MKELRDQLWDFVYGLLDEAESAELRQRICSDRTVAREYARVKLKSELVAQAARATAAERDLASMPRDALATPASLGQRISAARFIAVASSLALSIGMLAYAASVYWSPASPLLSYGLAQRLEEFQKDKPRMVVVGPSSLQAGTANTIEVQLEQLDGMTPLSLPVQAELKNTNDEVVWRETAKTTEDGRHFFHVPVNKDADGAVFKLSVAAGGQVIEDEIAPAAAMDTYLAVQRPRGELAVTSSVASTDGQRYERRVELTAESTDDADQKSAVDNVLGSPTGEPSDRPALVSSSRDAQVALDELEEERSKIRLKVQSGSKAPIERKYLGTVQAQTEGDAVSQASKKLSRFKTTAAPAPTPTAAPGTAGGGEESVSGTDSRTAGVPDDFAEAPAPVTSNESTSGTRLPEPSSAEGNAAAAYSQTTPVENAPVAGEGDYTVAGAKASKSFAENDRAALSSRTQELVEQIVVNGQAYEQRLVKARAGKDYLKSRLKELQDEGRFDPKVPSRIDAVLYDVSQAPPQKVAESTLEISPPSEPLGVSVTFDRDRYYAGETVVAEVHVSDYDGEPVACVLNVQVDALTPQEADRTSEPQPVEYSYVSADDRAGAPLVFDNAGQQREQLRRQLQVWIAGQQAAQARLAGVLLWGSAAGYALLMVALALRWRPKPSVWVPMVLVLSVTLGAGVFVWRRDASASIKLPPSVSPLTTHGVQPEPPAVSATLETENRSLEGRKEDLLKLTDLERVSRLDDLLERTSDDEASELIEKLAENSQRLPTMNEWAAIASASGDIQAESQEFYAFRGSTRHFREENPVDLFSAAGSFDLPGLQPAVGGAIRLGNSPERFDSPEGFPKVESPRQSMASGDSGTVYWHPVVSTDASGSARVDFSVPAGSAAYRLRVQARKAHRSGAAYALVPSVITRRP